MSCLLSSFTPASDIFAAEMFYLDRSICRKQVTMFGDVLSSHSVQWHGPCVKHRYPEYPGYFDIQEDSYRTYLGPNGARAVRAAAYC